MNQWLAGHDIDEAVIALDHCTFLMRPGLSEALIANKRNYAKWGKEIRPWHLWAER
ncbi:MAG: hypothetical protein K0S45_3873 [Nitrospira sp.]|jgi:hypothetical protein|nr:hypothetical protein [Nitrospira sp.]